MVDIAQVATRLATHLNERYSALLRWPLDDLLIANLRVIDRENQKAEAHQKALNRPS